MEKLKFGFHKVHGRSSGKITSYQRGGGKKVVYRAIDFYRFLPSIQGRVLKVIPDSMRSANIFLIGYTNGILAYSLSITNLNVGDFVFTDWSGKSFNLDKIGVSCPLLYVKPNTFVHNVELTLFKGGQLARSAGVKATLLKKFKNTGLLKLPSGQIYLIPLHNLCTIGEVGSPEHKLKKIGKAGINRLMGRRPHVRGQAMNPVDHPHGGRTNGGKIPCTPWGRLAKGVKTSRMKGRQKVGLNYNNVS